jgi:hypothetical protein
MIRTKLSPAYIFRHPVNATHELLQNVAEKHTSIFSERHVILQTCDRIKHNCFFCVYLLKLQFFFKTSCTFQISLLFKGKFQGNFKKTSAS